MRRIFWLFLWRGWFANPVVTRALVVPVPTTTRATRNAARLPTIPITSTRTSRLQSSSSSSNNDNDNDDKDKFGFVQRIDSVKSLLVGALVGSIAIAIPEAIHAVLLAPAWNLPGAAATLAQFEFDCDAAAVTSGLFAIVYRYGVRQDTNNPQLNQGLVSAFVVTRTLSRVVLPSYCTAVSLHCGPPFGYVDWNVLAQLAVNGAESAVLYSATAAAMDACMTRGWISRFPG